MTYSIIGTGKVGLAIASLFAKHGVTVKIANRGGPNVVGPIIRHLGNNIFPSSVEDALLADIMFFAVPFINFKDVAALRSDWSGRIVVDITNSHKLSPDVAEKELQGRLSSEVNADRLPTAKLVKAFNQLPMEALIAAVPDQNGRRVVFVSSDDSDASKAISELAFRLGFAPIELGKIAEGGRLIQVGNALALQDLIKFGS